MAGKLRGVPEIFGCPSDQNGKSNIAKVIGILTGSPNQATPYDFSTLQNGEAKFRYMLEVLVQEGLMKLGDFNILKGDLSKVFVSPDRKEGGMSISSVIEGPGANRYGGREIIINGEYILALRMPGREDSYKVFIFRQERYALKLTEAYINQQGKTTQVRPSLPVPTSDSYSAQPDLMLL